MEGSRSNMVQVLNVVAQCRGLSCVGVSEFVSKYMHEPKEDFLNRAEIFFRDKINGT